MQFDNATNLDRKSGVRGTKKTGRSPTNALAISPRKDGACVIRLQGRRYSEGWATAVAIYKNNRGASPGFPMGLGGIKNSMRLSLEKAAHASAGGTAYRKSGSPPLRRPTYPGFPVEVGGVVELHAAFLKESRTRGPVWCFLTGNPGALGRTWGTHLVLPTLRPYCGSSGPCKPLCIEQTPSRPEQTTAWSREPRSSAE